MRIVFKILFTVSIVTVLLVVGYEYLTAYYQATAHIAKIRTLHVKNLHSEKVDRFLRDLKVVESMNPFSLAEGGKDAGILLNKGLPMPIKGTDAPAHETLVPTLFSNPSDWSNSGATLPVKQLLELDVDWVASLSAYSHWDLDQSGIAAQKELSEYAIMGWVNKSISRNIQVAQIASYAVLLQGHRNNNLQNATNQLLHFAMLASSTENLMMSRLTPVIVSTIRAFYETQGISFKVHIPLEWLEHWERLTTGARSLIHPFTPAAILERVYLQQETSKALCASVREGLSESFLAREFVGGDKDGVQFYRIATRIFERYRGVCRLNRIKEYWNRTDFFPMRESAVVFTETGHDFPQFLVLDQHIGELINAMTSSPPLSEY